MRKSKGITLIALIITIIVMLILVAVSVSILINSGIIGKAQKAKTDTQSAYAQEQRLGDSINLEGTVYNSIDEIVNSNSANVIRFHVSYILVEKDKWADTGVYTIYPVDLEGRADPGMTWSEWSQSEYFNQFIEETNAKITAIGRLCGGSYCNFWRDSSSPCEGFGAADIFGFYAEFVPSGNSSTVSSGIPRYIPTSEEIEPNGEYSICGTTMGECVLPNSNILNDLDGNTTLAKDIKENDKIAYYNYETETIEIGEVSKVYIHRDATSFVRYTFEDGSYLEATDYHPIYTKEGWKSQTNRNGYEKPVIGDEVKTENGWKKLIEIEEYTGKEDCYDFAVTSAEGKAIDNYFANGTLVQNSI